MSDMVWVCFQLNTDVAVDIVYNGIPIDGGLLVEAVRSALNRKGEAWVVCVWTNRFEGGEDRRRVLVVPIEDGGAL